ncbi:hypothetical protein H7J86_32395 [Mycobacterium hackensackense]|uniref:hypothetical protein n=1 Tax=Mycobacterium hackensackense TaxID=228909 RepID=UPI002265C617|nr:hypothetical protein [Mycobacterium hackensackense]MCV7256885.1 hypothetical protein [Mycobacterium hackensackense]
MTPTAKLSITTECALGWRYGNRQVITKISWDLIGEGTKISSGIQTPNKETCTIDIPMPAHAGNYDLGGLAEFEFDDPDSGGRATGIAKIFYGIPNERATIPLQWAGTNTSHTINIAFETKTDNQGNPLIIFLFVWNN